MAQVALNCEMTAYGVVSRLCSTTCCPTQSRPRTYRYTLQKSRLAQKRKISTWSCSLWEKKQALRVGVTTLLFGILITCLIIHIVR